MTDKEKIEALHDKIETLHGDLDAFAHEFGCDDANDRDFVDNCSIEGCIAAGLTEEEAEMFMAFATEIDGDRLRDVAHHIYWSAK